MPSVEAGIDAALEAGVEAALEAGMEAALEAGMDPKPDEPGASAVEEKQQQDGIDAVGRVLRVLGCTQALHICSLWAKVRVRKVRQ